MFFAPPLGDRIAGDAVDLAPEEARHVRAARLPAGGIVTLTDGDGSVWSGRVARADGRHVRVVLLESLAVPPPMPVRLAFGVASRARMLWLLEKAVEHGVSQLQPVEFALSKSVADAGRTPAFWQKARRRMVSAMKQSGRGRLPALAAPVSLRALPDALGGSGGPRILLDAEGEPLWGALEGWTGESPAILLVGPEGGIEREEGECLAAAGFRSACVSEGVLRFETAAVAAMAVAWQVWMQRREAGGGERGRPRTNPGGEQ